MKERPILFSGAMVRQILSSEKRQTRRIVKPQPDRFTVPGAFHEVVSARKVHICPYGRPGDRLWMRETFAELLAVSPQTDEPLPIGPGERLIEPPTQWIDKHGRTRWNYDGKVIAYRANSDIEFCDGDGFGGDQANRDDMPKWKPSIHMPRKFSRITLEVTGVRVERLQDISEEDAKTEGVRPIFETHPSLGRDQRMTSGELMADAPYRAAFALLWDTINGDRALWKTNPFVWVIDFQMIHP